MLFQSVKHENNTGKTTVNTVDLKIINQKRNELLKRLEVKFQVIHEKSGTPTRIQVRRSLANSLDVDEERVYIKKIETKTGTNISICEANIYDSVSEAESIEPEHIILRNRPKEKEESET